MSPLEVLLPGEVGGGVVGRLSQHGTAPRHGVGAAGSLTRLHAVLIRPHVQQHGLQPLSIIVDVLILVEVWLLAVLYVVVDLLLDILDLLGLHLAVIKHPASTMLSCYRVIVCPQLSPQQSLQLLDVIPVLLNPHLALLLPGCVVGLALLLLVPSY